MNYSAEFYFLNKEKQTINMEKFINDIMLDIPVINLDAIWKGNFKDLPPNQNYQLIIDYPIHGVPIKFNIKTGKKGINLFRLLSIIGEKYQYIYDHETDYNIYGHDIYDLQLEGITVNHKKKIIELSVGS